MQQVEINIEAVANILAGHAVAYGGAVAVTGDLTVHRFEGDTLHVLVDGCGGYRALRHPGTQAESLLKEGHLSEFRQAS